LAITEESCSFDSNIVFEFYCLLWLFAKLIKFLDYVLFLQVQTHFLEQYLKTMEQIKSELVSLRLSGMAEALKTLQEGRKIHELTLTDGLRLLVQAERDQREANRYKRLVKNASFRYRASLEELSFDTARGLDRTQILSLANGSYIRDAGSILITGATGCGKSFVATALGHQACRQGFSVIYYGMQKLMAKLNPHCS
jgi:DNA replication protein DnaC